MLKVNDFFWAADTDPENEHAGKKKYVVPRVPKDVLGMQGG